MSEEKFYQEFDRECFGGGGQVGREEDHRSAFARDRDRLLYSNAFRRLQAKTQVFQAGEYDFYRTRLTHSLEVATIAKSIVNALVARGECWREDFRPDPDLLEAVSLAHDIGHPPFGHAGERVLNELLAAYGGFEGNAQSLRILTRIFYDQGASREGMAPSRALLDGILKYKRLYRDRAGEPNHFIYDDQAEVLAFCFGTEAIGDEVPEGTPVNAFRSVECQIMDLADDIAYSSADVVDAIRARFISSDDIARCIAAKRIGDKELAEEDIKLLEHLRERVISGHFEASINKRIGWLIGQCRVERAENFMSARTHRHAFRVSMSPEGARHMRVYKTLARDLVFGSAALRQIEYKGGHMLRRVVEALEEAYLTADRPRSRLLSGAAHTRLAAEPDRAVRARLIGDYVSGMTDAYAVRTYRRLFDPDYGSISELL